MHSDKPIKVNIGSGPQGRTDWVNLDWGILPLLSKMPWLCSILAKMRLLPKTYCRLWPSNPRLWDCRKSLPFRDYSVDFIYTSHFIEHLPRYQAAKLFAECKRILRPSGVLRICVPNVRLLAEKYVQGDRDFFLTLDNSDINPGRLKDQADLLVQHFYGYDLWSEPTLVQKLQRLFIRGHLWMYDYESLSNLLYTAGFSTVERCAPAQGKVPDIDYLDIHRTGSLFVEAFLGAKDSSTLKK